MKHVAGRMNVHTLHRKGSHGAKIGKEHSLGFLESMLESRKYLNRKQKRALEKLTNPRKRA